MVLLLLPQFLASSLHRSAPSRLFKFRHSFHPTSYPSSPTLPSIPFRYYPAISPPRNASNRFLSILLTVRTPPLEGSRGKSYSTANAEVVLGEEPSYHVEEGMLEAKQQEVDSLKSSMEELNKEIEKLKELQKQKLAELEKLEEEVDEKKVESHAAPSEFRTKKETNNGTPSSVAPSAAEAEVVKQMTLETLRITEELEDEQKTFKLKKKCRVKKEEEHSEMVDEKLVKAEDGELKKSKSNSTSSSYARRRGTSSEEIVEADDAQEVKHSPEKIRRVTLEVSEIVAGSNRKLPAKKLSFSTSKKPLTENKSKVASESPVSYSGSSTLSDEATTIGEQSGLGTKLRSGHPWPEWVAFLEHLETNNYFDDEDQGVSGRGNLFDESSVKHAVNRFGRDRDDIFRFLSKKDIKVIANFGCPNTDRKAVNCAKRLRVLCNVTEGEVCQECRLKKSCTRAFNQPASDVAAGTLDVVRVLFPYAVNVLPSSKSHESYPEDLNTSVCNLLKQLVQLSANPRDPNIPKPKPPPVVKKNVDRERAVQNFGDSSTGLAAYDDWRCTNCDFANFGRNRFCRRCGVYRPSIELKPGDWECPNLRCRFQNFAKNTACLKCETARPARVERTEGEWHEGSRRVKFQEDYNGGWGRVDKSTSRPHSRWKDGHSSRERGNNTMTLDSRGGTQRYKHEEWKLSDDENGDFANSDESEDDAATSNLDTVDDQELDDDEESSNEEDEEWGLAKGVKTNKRSSTRWSFDTSEDDDNDDEPNGGNDRRRRTHKTTQVTDWRNEAKGRRVNRDQDSFGNRDPDGGGYRSTSRGSGRDGRSNGRKDTERESFGNRDPDGGGYRSTSRGSFRNGRSNGRKDTERGRSKGWKR